MSKYYKHVVMLNNAGVDYWLYVQKKIKKIVNDKEVVDWETIEKFDKGYNPLSTHRVFTHTQDGTYRLYLDISWGRDKIGPEYEVRIENFLYEGPRYYDNVIVFITQGIVNFNTVSWLGDFSTFEDFLTAERCYESRRRSHHTQK